MTKFWLSMMLIIATAAFGVAQNRVGRGETSRAISGDSGDNNADSNGDTTGHGDGGTTGHGEENAAPEIDPSSAASAVALLAGSITIVRGRRKK